jgi:hypothetical protein
VFYKQNQIAGINLKLKVQSSGLPPHAAAVTPALLTFCP